MESERRPRPKLIEKLEARRATHRERSRLFRIGFGIVGALVLLGGVVMLVTPGPAFVLIPIGLAMLSLEFVWAERLLEKSLEQAQIAQAEGGADHAHAADPRGDRDGRWRSPPACSPCCGGTSRCCRTTSRPATTGSPSGRGAGGLVRGRSTRWWSRCTRTPPRRRTARRAPSCAGPRDSASATPAPTMPSSSTLAEAAAALLLLGRLAQRDARVADADSAAFLMSFCSFLSSKICFVGRLPLLSRA